jgi:hypothetical protein
MTDEFEDLRCKLSDFKLLQERCRDLENTLAEMGILYRVSQINSSVLESSPYSSASTKLHTNSSSVSCVQCDHLGRSLMLRDVEIQKLRGRLSTCESEFQEERGRLIEKIMKSEEAKRAAEAALKENDSMWETLFNTKMKELQAQFAEAIKMKSVLQPSSCEQLNQQSGGMVPCSTATNKTTDEMFSSEAD